MDLTGRGRQAQQVSAAAAAGAATPLLSSVSAGAESGASSSSSSSSSSASSSASSSSPSPYSSGASTPLAPAGAAGAGAGAAALPPLRGQSTMASNSFNQMPKPSIRPVFSSPYAFPTVTLAAKGQQAVASSSASTSTAPTTTRAIPAATAASPAAVATSPVSGSSMSNNPVITISLDAVPANDTSGATAPLSPQPSIRPSPTPSQVHSPSQQQRLQQPHLQPQTPSVVSPAVCSVAVIGMPSPSSSSALVPNFAILSSSPSAAAAATATAAPPTTTVSNAIKSNLASPIASHAAAASDDAIHFNSIRIESILPHEQQQPQRYTQLRDEEEVAESKYDSTTRLVSPSAAASTAAAATASSAATPKGATIATTKSSLSAVDAAPRSDHSSLYSSLKHGESLEPPSMMESELAILRLQYKRLHELSEEQEKTNQRLAKQMRLMWLLGALALFGLICGALYLDKQIPQPASGLSGLTAAPAVGSTALGNSSVYEYNLATGAVSSRVILDGTVSTVDLGNQVVTVDKLTNDTLQWIATAALVDNTTLVKTNDSALAIAIGGVDSTHLGAAAVNSTHLAPGAVSEGKLANSVAAAGLIVDAVGALAVNTDNATLGVDSFDRVRVLPYSINSSHIAVEGVQGFNVADNTLTMGKFSSDVQALLLGSLFNGSNLVFGPANADFTFGRPTALPLQPAVKTIVQAQNVDVTAAASSSSSSLQTLAGGDLLLRAGAGSANSHGSVVLQAWTTPSSSLSSSSSSPMLQSFVTVDGASNRISTLSANLTMLATINVSSPARSTLSLSPATVTLGVLDLASSTALSMGATSAQLSAPMTRIAAAALAGAPNSGVLSLKGDSSVQIDSPLVAVSGAVQYRPVTVPLNASSPRTYAIDLRTISTSTLRFTGSSGGNITIVVSGCDESRVGLSLVLMNNMTNAQTDMLYVSRDTCNGQLSVTVEPGAYTTLTCMGALNAAGTAVLCARQGTSAAGLTGISAVGTIRVRPNIGNITLDASAGVLSFDVDATDAVVGQRGFAQFTLVNRYITAAHVGAQITIISSGDAYQTSGQPAFIVVSQSISVGRLSVLLFNIGGPWYATMGRLSLLFTLV